MTKKHLYMAIQASLGLLFFIGFFVPLHVVRTSIGSGTASMADKENSTLFILLYLTALAGTIVFTHFKDLFLSRGTLFTLILLAKTTLLFFIEGIRYIEHIELLNISITLGFAPFYMLIITLLTVVYYVKHESVHTWLADKLPIQSTQETQTPNEVLYSELERIKDLHMNGVLTGDEYQMQKASILKKLELEK